MKYPGFDMNQDKQLTKCAICENEDISEQAEYCIICSAPVINKCLGLWDGDYNNPCDNKCQGNARYCERCGNQTTFLEKGILKPWNEKPANAFAELDDDDGELPF